MFKSKKILFVATIIFIALFSYNSMNSEIKTTDVKYSEFTKQLENNEISTIDINNSYSAANKIVYTKKESDKLADKNKKYYKVLMPSFVTFWSDFYPKNKDKNNPYSKIEVKMSEIPQDSLFIILLKSFLPMLFIIGIIILAQRYSMGMMSKNQIKLIPTNKIDVKFSDVIGIDEVKSEFEEIVDMIKNKDKYKKANARMPKGIILSGSPGTGKTMLAKALAKEAGVPVFTCSGSSFVEMFVGLGASRVRDLFKQAKKVAPCIIFIDEIDAIGGKRGQGIGGHDERENTLNELLTQMDGVLGSNDIFVMGATNRLETLDKALLRAGRFDRQIVVPLPNFEGRKQLIEKLSKNYNISDDFNVEELARGTIGRSGADITNIMNEASLVQVKQNKEFLDKECFNEALDKVVMGIANGAKMNEQEKRRTAFHEAGHAVVGIFSPESDPVHKVTIMPRGNALGVTMSMPAEDKVSYTKTYLLSQISLLLAGFCAEQKFIGDVTTGASNDIERATAIVKNMILKFGMGKNLMQYVYIDTDSFGNENLSSLSNAQKEQIEKEIEEILKKQKQHTEDILESKKNVINAMVKMLLKKEIITESDIKQILKDELSEEEFEKLPDFYKNNQD